MIRYNLRGEQNVEHDSSHKSPWIRMKRRWHARQRERDTKIQQRGRLIHTSVRGIVYSIPYQSLTVYLWYVYTSKLLSIGLGMCSSPFRSIQAPTGREKTSSYDLYVNVRSICSLRMPKTLAIMYDSVVVLVTCVFNFLWSCKRGDSCKILIFSLAIMRFDNDWRFF